MLTTLIIAIPLRNLHFMLYAHSAEIRGRRKGEGDRKE